MARRVHRANYETQDEDVGRGEGGLRMRVVDEGEGWDVMVKVAQYGTAERSASTVPHLLVIHHDYECRSMTGVGIIRAAECLLEERVRLC